MVNALNDEFVSLDDLALELCNGGTPPTITQGKILTGKAAVAAAEAGIAAAQKLGGVGRAEVQEFFDSLLDQKNPDLKGWGTVKIAMANHCAQAVTQKALALLSRVGLPMK